MNLDGYRAMNERKSIKVMIKPWRAVMRGVIGPGQIGQAVARCVGIASTFYFGSSTSRFRSQLDWHALTRNTQPAARPHCKGRRCVVVHAAVAHGNPSS
jgi:hypothetical protein